jgi:hypothetical protein
MSGLKKARNNMRVEVKQEIIKYDMSIGENNQLELQFIWKDGTLTIIYLSRAESDGLAMDLIRFAEKWDVK